MKYPITGIEVLEFNLENYHIGKKSDYHKNITNYYHTGRTHTIGYSYVTITTMSITYILNSKSMKRCKIGIAVQQPIF